MGRTIDFSEFLSISASVSSDEMMGRVLTHSRKLTGAEAGTIFLVRREGGKKWLEATHFQNDRIPVPRAGLRVPLNTASIAGYAAETGKMLRIPDAYRIGEVGEGWKVALTTLGFERDSSGEATAVGGTLDQVVELSRATGAVEDPVLRQVLADVVIAHRLAEVAAARDAATPDTTGVGGSMRKLQWTNRLAQISDYVAEVLEGDLVVDDGESGTFDWTEHVLGAPGYRIAGGSDEVQRNLIAERWLGLPAEPRGDKTTPWRDIPR